MYVIAYYFMWRYSRKNSMLEPDRVRNTLMVRGLPRYVEKSGRLKFKQIIPRDKCTAWSANPSVGDLLVLIRSYDQPSPVLRSLDVPGISTDEIALENHYYEAYGVRPIKIEFVSDKSEMLLLSERIIKKQNALDELNLQYEQTNQRPVMRTRKCASIDAITYYEERIRALNEEYNELRPVFMLIPDWLIDWDGQQFENQSKCEARSTSRSRICNISERIDH